MHERSKQHMPLGVADSYRYWGDGQTLFIQSGQGGRVTDVDGNTYVDFRLSYGPIILGYRDHRVDGAVMDAISRTGSMFGLSVEAESAVAERLKAMCPHIELLRFANSGTEACMGALRTARAFTGRSKFIVVEGGFHGLFDQMMWQPDVFNWDRNAAPKPQIRPFGSGIPAHLGEFVLPVSLNDVADIEGVFAAQGHDVAAVFIEPIMGNCGSISATGDYLKKVRALCNAHGALLIIDEVKTGFRVGKSGVQGLLDISADLTTYAKSMANGYAIAVFGGRRDVMAGINFSGGVTHGGTYTANVVGLSAALKTLEILDTTPALETVRRCGQQISGILSDRLRRHGIDHCIVGPSSMFGVHLVPDEPKSYRSWTKAKNDLYVRFARALLDNGILVEPDSREPWFICEAHRDMDLQWFEEAVERSLTAALDDIDAGELVP